MTKPLLALALFASLAPLTPAQTPDAIRSEAIVKKTAQLDALIQIVPLALTKEQILPLLTAIEKFHQKQKELFGAEAKELATLEPKLDKLVDEGVNKSVYPPREQQALVAASLRNMGLRRQILYGAAVEDLFGVCKATLNAGQLKAMEKSLKPDALDPSVKVAEMDSDAKVKFFIRKVILDAAAYDVLVMMSRRKEE